MLKSKSRMIKINNSEAILNLIFIVLISLINNLCLDRNMFWVSFHMDVSSFYSRFPC